jgi:hypothetical protein
VRAKIFSRPVSRGLLKSTKPQCEPSRKISTTAHPSLEQVSLTRSLIPNQRLHLSTHAQHYLPRDTHQHVLLLPQIPLRKEIRKHDPPRQRIPRVLNSIRPTRMPCRRQKDQRAPGLHLRVGRLFFQRQPLVVPEVRPGDHERGAVFLRGSRPRDQDPDLPDILPSERPLVRRPPDVLVPVERLLFRAGPHVEADAQGEPGRDVCVSGLHVGRPGVVGTRDVHVQELGAEADQKGVEADVVADGGAARGERPEEFGFLREEGPRGGVGEVVVGGEVGGDCGEHGCDVSGGEHVFDDEAAVAEEDGDWVF